MEPTTTLLLAIILACLVFTWLRRHDPRLPPCPCRPLPVLGHLPYLAGDSRVTLRNWVTQCGDIFSLYMGSTLMVVLNGYDLIKEALVKKADYFSDRPPYFINEVINKEDLGIVFSSGRTWKEQRAVATSILKSFGMGKNVLTERIQEEVVSFLDYLRSLAGRPTDIHVMLHVSMANIICSILIGRRFEYSDQRFEELIENFISILSEMQNVSVVNFMSWLRYLPGDLFHAKRLAGNMEAIFSVLQDFLKEHKREVVGPEDISNFIDAYIVEQEKRSANEADTTMNDKNLLQTMFDLLLGGSDTSSTAINWFVLYMLHYPEEQAKIYQEIVQVVGKDRAPDVHDKSRLIYTQAAILETQRLASITPLSAAHLCSQDVSLRGYIIPKGAYIIPHLDAVLQDRSTWGQDSASFRPARFIGPDGKLNVPEQFITFSMGRRACLGESIARVELFLFISNLVQAFQLLPASPSNVPPLDYICGAVVSPKPFLVRLVDRKH